MLVWARTPRRVIHLCAHARIWTHACVRVRVYMGVHACVYTRTCLCARTLMRGYARECGGLKARVCARLGTLARMQSNTREIARGRAMRICSTSASSPSKTREKVEVWRVARGCALRIYRTSASSPSITCEKADVWRVARGCARLRNAHLLHFSILTFKNS